MPNSERLPTRVQARILLAIYRAGDGITTNELVDNQTCLTRGGLKVGMTSLIERKEIRRRPEQPGRAGRQAYEYELTERGIRTAKALLAFEAVIAGETDIEIT